MNKLIWKVDKLIYRIAVILVAFFCITKLHRNSLDLASYEQQGGLWNIVTILFYILAIWAIFKKQSYVAPLGWALVFAVFSIVNALLTLNVLSLSYLYNAIMLPYFVVVMVVFYSVSRNLDNNDEKFTLICCMAILFFNLYTYLLYWSSSTKMEIMLNNSYFSLCFLPLVIRTDNKILKKIAVMLICFTILLSTKRAGIIALFLAMFSYYFVGSLLENSTKKLLKRICSLAIVMVILVVLTIFCDSYFQLGLMRRFSVLFSEGGSGRDIIYTYVWNEIINADIKEIILGHGVLAITKMDLSISSAHNDLLNFMYELGLVPTFLVIGMYVSLFRVAIKMIKMKYEETASFVVTTIISFSLSMFSANLDSYSFCTCIAMCWGIQLAQWKMFLLGGQKQNAH